MNIHTIDKIVELIVDGREAEAVFKLLSIRRNMVLDDSSRPGPATDADLPNLRPITTITSPGHRVKSVQVDCPTCKAKAGRPCFMMEHRGSGAGVTSTVKVGYHLTRSERAQGKR